MLMDTNRQWIARTVSEATALRDSELRTLIAQLRTLLHRRGGPRREGQERIRR